MFHHLPCRVYTSFAVKYNTDILNYAIPPFAGILREIYDIEDYKALKLTKTELENYAIYRDRVKAVMPENMKISKPYIDKQLIQVY